MSEHVFLEMSDVSMTFPGVKALDKVRLDIREGEVLSLIHILKTARGNQRS